MTETMPPAAPEAPRFASAAQDAYTTRLYCPAALARAFGVLQRERLRHVAAWKCWMAWDGRRWCRDDTLLALDLAGEACRDAAEAARRSMRPPLAARVADRLGTAGAIAAVERVARANRRLAARPAQWDADADLLNTPSGIVDTRSGETLPHRPDAYMTRIAAVDPAAPGTPCPLWTQWLDRLAGGDAALAFYLQRVAGRALTGRDPAPALAFSPDIGRSGLFATLRRIRGDASEATVSDAENDPDFTDRLEAEHPAILRWAIDGCLAWRRIGLSPPDSARMAAERRRAAADDLGRWLEENAVATPTAWASAGALYADWQDWAEQAGVDPGSQKRFSQALEARGFAPKRRRTGQRGFLGLALRPAAVESRAPAHEDACDPSSVISLRSRSERGCRAGAQPSLAKRVMAAAPQPARAKAGSCTTSYGLAGRQGEDGLVHGELRLDEPSSVIGAPEDAAGAHRDDGEPAASRASSFETLPGALVASRDDAIIASHTKPSRHPDEPASGP